jgi:hypothetical protein
MKPVNARSSIGLDRLATCNEVICAIMVSTRGAFPLVGGSEDLREVDSDFRDTPCNPAEETMWLAIASGMPDSKSN